MKNNIDMRQITLEWLDGRDNEQLMKLGGFDGLPKLYHMLRGFLFSVAKENPEEIITLVKKSTGNFSKRIMGNKTERVRKQILVIEYILEGKTLVQISKLIGCSYTKVQALLKEFILAIAPDFTLIEYKLFLLIHEDELIARLKNVKNNQY